MLRSRLIELSIYISYCATDKVFKDEKKSSVSVYSIVIFIFDLAKTHVKRTYVSAVKYS